MVRTIPLGLYGRITLDTSKGLDAYAWPGGYPIVYYTSHADVLCAECATKQEIANQHEDWQYHGDTIDGADVLEGGAIDHGIVRCEQCNKEILGLDDDEWQCWACGAIHDVFYTLACDCGRTLHQQLMIENGQLELPGMGG